MKKLSLLTMLVLSINFAMAQDIDEVQKYAILAPNGPDQTAKAKDIIDKFMAVEKNAKKPEGWFYKGYIYNLASKDSAKTTMEQSAELKAQAFDALKKYREMDPKAELLQDQNNGPLYDLYFSYFSDMAIKAYQTNKIAAALENFKKAQEVHDYWVANNLTGANGFKFPVLDTLLALYTGIAATDLKKTDEAAVYYKKLTDANLTDEQYIDAYRRLADYYKTKKDKVAFSEILAKGRKYFPKDDEYWLAIEIEDAVNGVPVPAVFQNYQELVTKYPDNYNVSYYYLAELYNYIAFDSLKKINSNEYQNKLQELVKSNVLKSGFTPNFLMANLLANTSYDLTEAARKTSGTKPDDIKKRKSLEAESGKLMNEAVPYYELAVNNFASLTKPKMTDKVQYKQALTFLKSFYERKKDAAKVASFDKLLKQAD